MAGAEPDPLNPFLAVLGVVCMLIAAAGLFMERSEALAGGFLIGGVFLCIGSVMAPRMEGSQKVGLTGAEFTLGKLPTVIKKAENEVRTRRLPEIEEIL